SDIDASALVINAENRLLCPYCHTLINVGKAGIANWEKVHKGSKKCADNLKKWQASQLIAKTQANAAQFFVRKVPYVAPTVSAPQPIHSTSQHFPQTQNTTATCPDAAQLLSSFRRKILALPATVETADMNHPLAAFAGDPEGCVDHNEDAWEKWDGPLNTLLQREPKDLQDLVRIGENGLVGLHRFLEYLVNCHGVTGALLEGKLLRLMTCMDQRIANTVTEPSETAAKSPQFIIDVDNLPDKHATPHRTVSHQVACEGIRIDLPSGKSPHSTYPFGIHDMLGDPWDYSVHGGVMVLRSRQCSGQVVIKAEETRCVPCEHLLKNPNLHGILERMDTGVHENSALVYHGVGGLVKIIHRKTGQVRALRLRRLNDARKLVGKATALEDHKQWIMTIGDGNLERIERLVRIHLKKKGGIRALITSCDRAARHVYHPKSYTEEDDLRGILFWRIGGPRCAEIAHRALGLPSISTLRRRSILSPIISSPSFPTLKELGENVTSCFSPLDNLTQTHRVFHQILMFDELKVEERPRYDLGTNKIVGICREHGKNTSLDFDSEKEVELLLAAIEQGEATVGAIGVLSENTRIYSARPILVSGSCKRETGLEHANLIETALSASKLTKFRTISIASDGESRRGEALIRLTFKHTLASNSPIYNLLASLPLMNLEVGNDDLTPDKDAKHVFKRLRNLMLREKGVKIEDVHIKPSLISIHLRSNNNSSQRAGSLLNPNDKQDVKLAYELLHEVWSLPPAPSNKAPGFVNTRQSLQKLGVLFKYILMPYICVDFSLHEQLVHLSAAAHLVMPLFIEGKTTFMPTQLYVDIMIMIKNVYFCVAKTKVDNPDGCLWIVQLGTDRLEVLFGILRTMIGNDANVDCLQLGSRLTGTTEVSTILAMHPEWDRAPRRLKLPALDKDGCEIHNHVDHLGPASWRGDTRVSQINLQTCWKIGRQQIEKHFPHLTALLNSPSCRDIFSPFGKDLAKGPRDPDDVDDTVDVADYNVMGAVDPDLEDAATELDIDLKNSPYFELDGVKIHKSRFLTQAFAAFRKSGSTDRLKRVANGSRYCVKDEPAMIIEHDTESTGEIVHIDAPITTLVRVSGEIFVCIGEVIDITFNNQHIDAIGPEYLNESSSFITYQILNIIPTRIDDDPNGKHDWKWSQGRGSSHKVQGCLIIAINPSVSTRDVGKPIYLFESSVLMALGTTLLERISGNASPILPEIKVSLTFPYREPEGKACFLVEGENEREVALSIQQCPVCGPNVILPKSAQRVLEHMSAHILFDSKIARSQEPCGLCLRPSPSCTFHLRRSKGSEGGDQINYKKSHCANLLTFSYSVAAQSSTSSPSSNVPLHCPVCPPGSPAVWRYNLLAHRRIRHPTIPIDRFELLSTITHAEKEALEIVWDRRYIARKTRKTSKGKTPTLRISEAHSSRLTLLNEKNTDGSNNTYEGNTAMDILEFEPVEDAHDNLLNALSDVQPNGDDTDHEDSEDFDVDASSDDADITDGYLTEKSNEEEIDQGGCDTPTKPRSSLSTMLLHSSSSSPLDTQQQPTLDIAPVPSPRTEFDHEGPMTRVGRKRRAKDVKLLLAECACGSEVLEAERDDSIECKSKTCETQWQIESQEEEYEQTTNEDELKASSESESSETSDNSDGSESDVDSELELWSQSDEAEEDEEVFDESLGYADL
ncbi:hypothetical protein H0H93_001265, partial [Arthromyces matolae]